MSTSVGLGAKHPSERSMQTLLRRVALCHGRSTHGADWPGRRDNVHRCESRNVTTSVDTQAEQRNNSALPASHTRPETLLQVPQPRYQMMITAHISYLDDRLGYIRRELKSIWGLSGLWVQRFPAQAKCPPGCAPTIAGMAPKSAREKRTVGRAASVAFWALLRDTVVGRIDYAIRCPGLFTALAR
jgi:hypothetical protein